MNKAVITFGSEKDIINKYLFGHNLEHTRACMYGGLSAQMIRNRKFAGKGSNKTGVAPEWYLIGDQYLYCTLNRYDSYVQHYERYKHSERRNECNSLTLMNPVEGLKAGIGQNSLSIDKDMKYEIRVVLKARSEKPVPWGIHITDKNGTKEYWKQDEILSPGDWTKYSFTFFSDAEDDEAKLEIFFTNCAEVKYGVVSMLPSNHFHGMRRDVIERLREVGPTMLRWPGGNFAGEYRWKDGLLDVDQRGAQKSFREMETHPYSYGFDFHEINVDDFIALCREIGAEPYVTINLAWDTPEDCAEFVEYCNGDSSTGWGKIRAERGCTEPYNVIYWSLGNEFGLGHMEGPNTPEAYSEKAHQCAEKMREKDPRLILFASGSYNPEFDYYPWIEKSIPVLQDDITYISYHNYVPRIYEGDCGGIDFTSEKGTRKTYQTITDAPDECLKAVRELRRRLDENQWAKIQISYDEWNLYFAWFHNPGVIEGVYSALMMDIFCKNHLELKMPVALYFQPINEGAIRVLEKTSELTANGQAFEIMKCHAGRTMVDCAADTANDDLRCLASRNEDSQETVITIINKAYINDYEIVLDGKDDIQEAILYEGKCLFQGSKFTVEKPDTDHLILPAHSILKLKVRS